MGATPSSAIQNTSSSVIQSNIPHSSSKSLLNQEQLQKATSDTFTLYNISIGNPSITKVAVDMPNLQQCLNNYGSDGCISQYIKGFNNTNNIYQTLVPSVSNITADSGGNVIIPQNFQNIENNSYMHNTNTFIYLLVIVFIIVLLIKCK
jgi:hypothetical protein